MWFGGRTIGVSFDWADLTTCTPTAFRHGFYKGLLIVDSSGQLLRVKEARKIGYPTRFLGFGIHKVGKKGPRIIMRLITVEPNFESEVLTLELSDFKARVISAMTKERDSWSECMMSWHEMKDLIGQAKSFEEVMRLPFLQ